MIIKQLDESNWSSKHQVWLNALVIQHRKELKEELNLSHMVALEVADNDCHALVLVSVGAGNCLWIWGIKGYGVAKNLQKVMQTISWYGKTCGFERVGARIAPGAFQEKVLELYKPKAMLFEENIDDL